MACPTAALAHASEQSFVLLLPIGAYITGGLATIILTVIVIALIPTAAALRLFRPVALTKSPGLQGKTVCSLLSLVLLALLVWIGLHGSHDPTRNPLVVFTKPRMSVTIGAPIRVEKVKRPTEEQVSALTEQIFDAIKAMVLPKYLPPYTGTEGQDTEDNGDDHTGQ